MLVLVWLAFSQGKPVFYHTHQRSPATVVPLGAGYSHSIHEQLIQNSVTGLGMAIDTIAN